MYHDINWSKSEKKLAQQVFDAALKAELAEIVEDFKTRAAATAGIEGVWAIQEYLESKRREIDRKYDYRYSQLPLVFGRLLREGRIRMEQLDGLSGEKREIIQSIASL
ncbi:hypothetical protein [uncultured Azohydromonas sp.]|jgi:hypothetical protein|uniref:hypothetical protein n=1 Tax=uncultured Azohydromonas sp. TaxID=487342 RepID=UPI002617B2B9|nr:hypothetical protein [uncultured Azohydromonas sp.]